MTDKTTTIQVFGVKELDEFFEKMNRIDQRRLFIDSWRIGSKSMILTARQILKGRMKTKSRTKNLEKSIGFVAGSSRGKSVFVTAKIGARRFGQYKGYHGHLYDAGTTDRETKKGLSRGRMPATHFFTNAVEQTQDQFLAESQNNLMQALEKHIDKSMKKINNI